MSRELHDVVAHHLSLIAVQSEAAQVLLQSDPARADEAVGAIGTTARQALTELRRLLGALRQEGEGPGSLSPQPGDLAIGSLVDAVRDAGVPVELTVRGEPRPLPDAIALSAYRIVQESVTNVVKHAGPASASVVVRLKPALRVGARSPRPTLRWRPARASVIRAWSNALSVSSERRAALLLLPSVRTLERRRPVLAAARPSVRIAPCSNACSCRLSPTSPLVRSPPRGSRHGCCPRCHP